eukprot:7208917-Prymnesium_polylepis.2
MLAPTGAVLAIPTLRIILHAALWVRLQVRQPAPERHRIARARVQHRLRERRAEPARALPRVGGRARRPSGDEVEATFGHVRGHPLRPHDAGTGRRG